MTQPSFPEEMGESKKDRQRNLDEWMDIVEEEEVDEGDVTASEIMPGDLELAEDTLDDDLLNEYGMHIQEEPPPDDE